MPEENAQKAYFLKKADEAIAINIENQDIANAKLINVKKRQEQMSN